MTTKVGDGGRELMVGTRKKAGAREGLGPSINGGHQTSFNSVNAALQTYHDSLLLRTWSSSVPVPAVRPPPLAAANLLEPACCKKHGMLALTVGGLSGNRRAQEGLPRPGDPPPLATKDNESRRRTEALHAQQNTSCKYGRNKIRCGT